MHLFFNPNGTTKTCIKVHTAFLFSSLVAHAKPETNTKFIVNQQEVRTLEMGLLQGLTMNIHNLTFYPNPAGQINDVSLLGSISIKIRNAT